MEIRREQFVSSKDFLKSARDMGIGVEEGVYEIVDNALDAGAENIWIEIEKKDDGNFRFIFSDDGFGIPKEHTDDQGDTHQGIPYVLTYGGRIPNPHRPEPIGKFGFGLSQTASCLSSRTEVYTKADGDEQWRYSYYDFKELADSDCILPIETFRQPPWLMLPDSGTIVVMENVDQADYIQPNAIVAMLLKNLGRVYRMFLANGCNITISHGKSEKQVKISDPLVQLEDSLEVAALGGPSIDYGEVIITFDKSNPLGEIIDSETGEPAECAVVFKRLGIETVKTALNLPLVGVVGNPKPMNKWNINAKGQGFSVLRNGREIRSGESLGLFTKSGKYNFFRAQIAFSEALDGLFNVRTNKSRFSIDVELRTLLKEQLTDKIESIQKDTQAESKQLNSKGKKGTIPVAEIIAADVKHMLSKPRISDAEREQGKQEVELKIAHIVAKVEQQSQATVKKAESLLNMAKEHGEQSAIATAELNLKVTKEAAVKDVATIKQRFEFESNCRKFTDVVGTGGLFELKARGDHAWITINTATEFYSRVYSLAEKDANLESLLDLMIFSIAWSEHVDNHDQKPNWEHIRREISAQAEIFVSSMANLIEGGEA